MNCAVTVRCIAYEDLGQQSGLADSGITEDGHSAGEGTFTLDLTDLLGVAGKGPYRWWEPGASHRERSDECGATPPTSVLSQEPKWHLAG